MDKKQIYVAPEIDICLVESSDIVLISTVDRDGTLGKIGYDD
ncbi:MAG: hypothetical protein ACI3XR_05355 [Eubacteriales bacterium]